MSIIIIIINIIIIIIIITQRESVCACVSVWEVGEERERGEPEGGVSSATPECRMSTVFTETETCQSALC